MATATYKLLLSLGCLALLTAQVWSDDGLDRFSSENLAAAHRDVESFRRERVELPRPGKLKDYRANLHVHSAFSHDSVGDIKEIVAAANKVGTKVIMFTEHPADHYDFLVDGHQGLRDGVLLIPGAEMNGLHVYPRVPLIGPQQMGEQEVCDQVSSRDGLLFLCHLEERMDWELKGLTGSEIYNTHADFKDETRLMAKFRDPLWLLSVADLIAKYPQEAYSALHDYPADYLRRWDQLCELYPHTGVSANDAHQNVGFRARITAEGKVLVEDALGEKVMELDKAAFANVMPTVVDAPAETVLFQLQLDPYENALRHVGTHLLMPELSESAVREALRSGRAFVAFDWIADSTGFDVALQTDQDRWEMGSQLPFDSTLRLVGQSPLPAHWKVLKNGELKWETNAQALDYQIKEEGRYRVELWLTIAGKELPWILSNPFYIAKPQQLSP